MRIMRFSVGPSYRSYVIGQFVVIPGLLLTTHALVGIKRNWPYIIFLAAVSILVAGLATWRKNEPLTAAGMTSFMTAALFTLFPSAMSSIPILQQLRSLMNPIEFGMVIFAIAVSAGFVIVSMIQVMCLPVVRFSSRHWATPLWGQRRVPSAPNVRSLRRPGVGEK